MDKKSRILAGIYRNNDRCNQRYNSSVRKDASSVVTILDDLTFKTYFFVTSHFSFVLYYCCIY